MTSHWLPEAVAAIADRPPPAAPVILPVPPLLPGIDLWDYWPVQDEAGRVAAIDGGVLYFFLAAACVADPEDRHDRAHLRLLHDRAGTWHDLGPVFAAGFAPGSRQWSGCTVIDADRRLTLYFTAAGHRGEAATGYEQRVFVTSATLAAVIGRTPDAWSQPAEVVVPDGRWYAREMRGGGAIGTIKAFRDPFYFRDPADGGEHLLLTASLARSVSSWNGAIAVARRQPRGWTLKAPLIAADGLNNELERPHVIVHAGHYYVFWSTQAKVFAADGPTGPTGLYGMVADNFGGPWRPLNGTGLVIANPAVAPHQAYSWLVQHDLSVISFADFPGLAVAPSDPITARQRFGGSPAPALRLHLDGTDAVLT